MKKGNILIVDDNESALKALSMLLSFEYQNVVTISDPKLIPSKFRRVDFDVVLLDMNFSAGVNTGNEGLFWLGEIKKISGNTEVILITAYGDVELAVKALKKGASDFVLKPWENEKLLATINIALKLRSSSIKIEELKNRESSLKSALHKDHKPFIGSSPQIQKVMQMVEKVAKTDANILITGENGTGKDLIAQEIHNRSERANELLVMVDMGAITASLFESELFGHKKGAFTDAREDRVGKFSLANKGTLFLDEIGNIPMTLQSKLLTVLQNRTVIAVGSNKLIPIDIRLISATNSHIEKEVAEQRFREDLLYRLNTIRIELPPLRERGEDIELLATFFLQIYQKKYKKSKLKLSIQSIKKLMNYPWPGNVRELEHTIEKAVILSEGDVLKPEDFSLRNADVKVNEDFQTITEMEKIMIEDAIDKYNGNMTQVSEKLGITRQTLYNKIKRYGI